MGTVWSWLLGPFARAHFRVYGDARLAQSLLDPVAEHVNSACLGTVSEIFDGDAPHTARGCFAQAWSVAEILRSWIYLERKISKVEGNDQMNTERERLLANVLGPDGWKHWGPYLSERQWGTVREDYSPGGTAWEYFPHDHARSRAYRWGEDGIAGISDAEQLVCLSLGLWNGADPILKERLFGLTNAEGNHGEDVKEHYFYLDATPTHSYLKMLYKYPHRAFPYADLVAENARRGTDVPEYELLDTGVFAENRYFDVFVEYAKLEPGDILMKITAWNRGPTAALHLDPATGVAQHVELGVRLREAGAERCRARCNCRRACGTGREPLIFRRRPGSSVYGK